MQTDGKGHGMEGRPGSILFFLRAPRPGDDYDPAPNPPTGHAKDIRMSSNIIYRTDAIATYFGRHRRRWDDFYPSERRVFEQVGESCRGFGHVLDVGCAAGGLGAALPERFPVASYTGIDISASAIETARRCTDIPVPHEFLAGDVVSAPELAGRRFDTVFNLSCADWNVDTGGIMAATWRAVAPGGCMITTLRLTNGPGERGMARSFQFIHYGDAPLPDDAERAAYVVLNSGDALAMLGGLGPERVSGYGFWGAPSTMARTPFHAILFAVFAIFRAGDGNPCDRAVFDLDFPVTAWASPR